MKNLSFLFPFVIFISLSIFGFQIGKDEYLLVNQHQYQFPVLTNKDFNNVLQLEMNFSNSEDDHLLKEIQVNTDGTSNISDIEKIAIYYTGKDDMPMVERGALFAETTEIFPVVTLKGNLPLNGDRHFFWISYQLKDGAGLTDKIGAQCQKVVTDKGEGLINPNAKPLLLRTGVAVRKHKDDQVHTYRIPGLVQTNEGTLLACYDVRRKIARDLQGDIDIGISRSMDGGQTWEPMLTAMDMGKWGGLPEKFNGVSDATLLVDRRSGNIFLCGLWMHGVINKEGKWVENLSEESAEWNHQWLNKGSQSGFGVRETSQFLISRSTDDGKTWEPPVNLTRQCKKEEWWLWAPAPGNGITLSDGTLVLPTQGRDKYGDSFSNITYSKDGGITWVTSSPASTNTTECAVVELTDGRLMLNMRDNRNRNNKGKNNGRAIAVTNDLGETWAEHPTSHQALIEPVCMASLIKGGHALFFSNPDSKENRHRITIKASLDDGNTWPQEHWVLLDEGYGRGYTSLVFIDEEHLGILYESSQADMVFQKIPLKDFKLN